MLRGECVNGRWHEKVKAALPDGEIVFSRGEDDYQGSVAIIAKLDDGRWLEYAWSYGSCSGCDEWEYRTDGYGHGDYDSVERMNYAKEQNDKIDEEIRAGAKIMSKQEMKAFLLGCMTHESNWLNGSSYGYDKHVGWDVDRLMKELQ